MNYAYGDAARQALCALDTRCQRFGPALKRPHSRGIESSRHPHMKERIAQHAGRPYRVLYAFDSRRCAIHRIGGDQTGDARWYGTFVPTAMRATMHPWSP